MWAMRADSGSKMLAATVQVGRDITWRNRSRACDIMCPPFPLGSCPQSNRTPDLFSRDLHSAFFAQPPSYRARDEHVFACDPSYCASHRFASELQHCDTTLRTSKNTRCLFHKFMASSR